MKTLANLVPISLAALAIASPLGDRAVFQRHTGTPYRNARRYILQSRVDAPPACAALTLSTSTASPDLTNTNIPLSNATISPDLSNVTVPLSNTTGTADNSTSAGNSTIDGNPPPNVNSTTSAGNGTSSTNSTTPSRRSKRHWRRIAQDDLPAVAQSWQDLCLVSGGDIFTNEPCVKLAGLAGLDALLADADPCAQQDNADAMIAFARSAGVINTDDLIANAIAYRQHPRNAMSILGVVPSTVFCQKAPSSPELVGVVNAQLDGVDPGLFGSPNIPLMPFGAPGTCPFGQDPDVTTCTCVNSTTTEDPTSTSASNITTTDITNATATDTSAASETASGTDTTAIASTTDSIAPSTIADSSSTASATFSLGSSIAAPTESSVTTAAPAASSVVAVPPPASGPNFQPDDISGNVNDING